MNCSSTEMGMSSTRLIIHASMRENRNPAITPPTPVSSSATSALPAENLPVSAATVAMRNIRSAVASLKRLSPSSITNSRCGVFRRRSTAVAAAASGGDTIAPSAMAVAHDISGMTSRATQATAAMVRSTVKKARLSTGARLWRRSRGEASYAASSSTGATNKANASSGSRVTCGAPGMRARTPPPRASNAG